MALWFLFAGIERLLADNIASSSEVSAAAAADPLGATQASDKFKFAYDFDQVIVHALGHLGHIVH